MDYTVTAVVVCAGRSHRMGGVDKLFENVGGVPVLARTLLFCCKSECINDIVAVTRRESIEKVKELAKRYGISKPVKVIEGGDCRAKSALLGAKSAAGEYIAILDGARPLTDPAQADKVCRAAFEYGAAALGVPMTDTVKRLEDGMIVGTIDRSRLMRIQTPQAFEKKRYIELAQTAARDGRETTDDCSIYEMYGLPIKAVEGSVSNIKITTPEDISLCSALCAPRETRIGHGYDVHRLEGGRDLWLCGVKIEHDAGLAGHSDADVALHALIDAMLGAAGLGDIGKMFPDTDDSFKGISSVLLLERAAARVYERFDFGNCDITIIAQKPKLLPYIEKMRENVARALETDKSRVNIKATTEEGLGFTGRKEGVAAHAVCLLYRR